MVQDYVHRFYVPAARNWNQIQSEQFKGARTLTAWTNRLKSNWHQVKILEKRTDARSGIQVGQMLNVEVFMDLGSLSPSDLSVDIYYGRVDSKADFLDRSTITLHDFSQQGNQTIFRGMIPCPEVGRFGFKVRVLPFHPFLSNAYSLGLILWG